MQLKVIIFKKSKNKKNSGDFPEENWLTYARKLGPY